MNIRLANKITYDSIVDGPGLREVIWTQGCIHNCPNCHNPQTHDYSKGFDYDIDEIVKEIDSYPLKSGVTISGGDPFFQRKALKELVRKLKEKNINIWCFTGYLFEDLIKDEDAKEALSYVDVLVDGPYIDKLKSEDLIFRGSSNQRFVDCKNSLLENKVIELKY